MPQHSGRRAQVIGVSVTARLATGRCRKGGGITEAENHLENHRNLFKSNEPPLSQAYGEKPRPGDCILFLQPDCGRSN